jgi:hypothetical protein
LRKVSDLKGLGLDLDGRMFILNGLFRKVLY